MASHLPLDEPTKIVNPTYRLNGTYTITRDNTEKEYYEITNPGDNTKVLVPMDKIGEIEGFTNSEFANSADGVITTDAKSLEYNIWPKFEPPFYKVKKIKTSVFSFKKYPPSKEPMALMFPRNDIHVPTAYAEEHINPSTGGRRRNRRSTKKTRKHRRRTNRRLRR